MGRVVVMGGGTVRCVHHSAQLNHCKLRNMGVFGGVANSHKVLERVLIEVALQSEQVSRFTKLEKHFSVY